MQFLGEEEMVGVDEASERLPGFEVSQKNRAIVVRSFGVDVGVVKLGCSRGWGLWVRGLRPTPLPAARRGTLFYRCQLFLCGVAIGRGVGLTD